MAKLSNRGRRQQHTPGRAWEEDADSELTPLERAVQRRVGRDAVRKRLVRLQKQVLASLGRDAKLFLEVEQLWTEREAAREKAYFELGYQQGLAEGRARERRGDAKLTREAQAFAAETRERFVLAGLSPQEATLGLLECLWALAVQGERPAPQGEGVASAR